MSDLIDREALLRQIDIDSEGEPGYYGDTWKFIDTIKSMPPASCSEFPNNSDTISRQAAIDAFNTNLNELVVGGEENAKTVENYLNRVLDKIKCLPSALGTNLAAVGTDVPDINVGDMISRQAAIDIAKELTITIEGYEMHNQAVMNYCAEIIQLPPIQPKRGRWEMGIDERFVECSECGLMTTRNELRGIAVFGKNEPNFCPNCGADMRGEQNG